MGWGALAGIHRRGCLVVLRLSPWQHILTDRQASSTQLSTQQHILTARQASSTHRAYSLEKDKEPFAKPHSVTHNSTHAVFRLTNYQIPPCLPGNYTHSNHSYPKGGQRLTTKQCFHNKTHRAALFVYAGHELHKPWQLRS